MFVLTMTEQQEREARDAFEAFIIGLGRSVERFADDVPAIGGQYANTTVAVRWATWLAATERLLPRIAEQDAEIATVVRTACDQVSRIAAERDAKDARIAALERERDEARKLLATARPLLMATLNVALRWNDHNHDNDAPHRWAKDAADKLGFERNCSGEDAALAFIAAIDAAVDAAIDAALASTKEPT